MTTKVRFETATGRVALITQDPTMVMPIEGFDYLDVTEKTCECPIDENGWPVCDWNEQELYVVKNKLVHKALPQETIEKNKLAQKQSMLGDIDPNIVAALTVVLNQNQEITKKAIAQGIAAALSFANKEQEFDMDEIEAVVLSKLAD